MYNLRQNYTPKLPELLKDLKSISMKEGEGTTSISDPDELKKLFPKTFGRPHIHFEKGTGRTEKLMKIGVVLSGGQAAGGHNVISGIFDALKQVHPNSILIGFLNGPIGIIDGKYKILDEATLKPFRNTGGFNVIGSGRTKIESDEDLQKSKVVIKNLGLNGLVIIGGDDSNTNAAVLAEYIGDHVSVIGVPKTIDGDLKNPYVEVSFGFDTACKVYSEMIGNIGRDVLSAKKYYHFVKLMGRSASHIALECALKTHPNLTLIGEEVAENNQTIIQITDQVADVIERRAKDGKKYGLILIPEGLIEFIPEMKPLIKELNQLLSESELDVINVKTNLSSDCLKTFESLPEKIQRQLLLERDPHGNVQVAKIQTEELFMETVKAKGVKFDAISHYFGYEGRSGYPSNFDADYCYSLGHVAALLVYKGVTGYMCGIQGLSQGINQWKMRGIPITSLMNLELRKGKKKPVIQKALVDLRGKPFQMLSKNREEWMLEDEYECPGPIQFFGDEELTDSISMTLQLEQ